VLVEQTDNTIRIYDAESGKSLRTLPTRNIGCYSAAWSPNGKFIAAGTQQGAVFVWDAETGRLLREFEGHTAFVTSVAFSADSVLLCSRSRDGVIRLQNALDGTELAVVSIESSGLSLPSASISPVVTWLASPVESDTSVAIWELDETWFKTATPARRSVSYTSAKVVLVGESNVGKSSLAMRLVEDRYPEDHEHGTTHGMRFWPMEAHELHSSAKPPEGQRRDVVLWDFGGQDEHQLVHQMFLHDTTLALVLIDPTRGRAALDEARDWNKRLEKHIGKDKAVKILVGAKVDKKRDLIDRNSIGALCEECGFATFLDLSAKTGRNTRRLRRLISDELDWDQMAKTSRPELFQRIRDEIERQRKADEVVMLTETLIASLSDIGESIETYIRSEGRERTIQAINYGTTGVPVYVELRDSVGTVTDQLARQGVIVKTKLMTDDEALVLQLPIIERYSGSLVVAARNNPRGVPVLEERLLGSTKTIPLPGMSKRERISPTKERIVLECIVELMIQHGICFRHGGQLVFPTLFPTSGGVEEKLPHSVSLYYDFTGAIDNIYASLVAKLMVSEAFGDGRLWADRVEFDQPNKGVCGIRQRKRKGGLAHIDLFFAEDTATKRRELFTTFVDEHLRANGVSIQEHQAIRCRDCDYDINEDIVRQRLALDHDDVLCPLCGTKTRITEGVEQLRARDHDSEREVVALRRMIEDKTTRDVAAAKLAVSGGDSTRKKGDPIRLLHLSDLHFEKNTSPSASLQWLLQDLRNHDANFPLIGKVEYLVLSGDVTHQGDDAGFDKARQFVEKLIEELGLSSLRCVFVPGNHDVELRDTCYQLQSSVTGIDKRQYVKKADVYLVRDEANYPNRLKKFSDAFYHKVTSSLDYPLAPEDQGMSYLFEDTGVQFLALNTAWEIDQFFPGRATVHPQALADAISKANNGVENAIERGDMKKNQARLRIGVFHHAINGPWAMQNLDFVGNLQAADVKLCLHGDVHEMRRQWIEHWDAERSLHVVGAGTFGAKRDDITEGSARSYNLLEIASDLQSVRVYVREQPKPDGAWRGWNQFPDPDGGRGKVPFFDIKF
jgi:small GTP-binding protein